MRLYRVVAIAFCGILFGGIWAQAQTCIQIIKIVDVAQGIVTTEKDVVLNGSVITDIRDIQHRKKTHACKIVDGTGKFLMPGLIDSHVHVDLWHYGVRADEFELPLAVLHGVTSARDAAGSPATLKLRDEVLQGLRFGPTLMVSSPFLSSDPKTDTPGNNVVYVKSAEDATQKVTGFFAQGYSAIKLDINLTSEAYEAAAKAAANAGGYVYGHP